MNESLLTTRMLQKTYKKWVKIEKKNDFNKMSLTNYLFHYFINKDYIISNFKPNHNDSIVR